MSTFANNNTNNSACRSTDFDNQPQWYILHTFSNYESMAKVGLSHLVENCNLQEQIFDVRIPTEQTLKEYKNGKKKVVEKKLMPGYIFVKMIYSNQLGYLVSNVRGITGFVGPMGRPVPMTAPEVRKMHLEESDEGAEYAVGDEVTVLNGPLAGFTGTIQECNPSTQIAKVAVTLFGLKQEVELEYVQLEKK